MAMTSPYAAIESHGFAAKYRPGPGRPSKREAARSLAERDPNGSWERIEAERKANMALRKAQLRWERENGVALPKEEITAADFRFSALENAVKV